MFIACGHIYAKRQSLCLKLPGPTILEDRCKAFVSGVTETWAHPGISDAEVGIQRMHVLRIGRNMRMVRGRALCISNKLKATHLLI